MATFTSYPAPWTTVTTDAIIGPDGNLWVVTFDNHIYRFNTTTFVVTTFVVTGATALQGLCTDGTYVYAIDQQAVTAPYTVVFKITTAGVSSVFFNSPTGVNGGNGHFDGTYIWVTSASHFWKLDLTGVAVTTYTAPINFGGGLINDGTYWWSGCAGYDNGLSRSSVSSPGTWTTFTAGLTATNPSFPTVFAGGVVWFGNGDRALHSIVPSTGVVTNYALSLGFSSQQVCYDGTSLWATVGNFSIWQTTTSAPSVGTSYNYSTTTILYDPVTKAVWSTGNGFVVTTMTTPNHIVMVL